MRIAILCADGLTGAEAVNGQSDYIQGLSTALAKKNNEVHVFAPSRHQASGYASKQGVHYHTIGMGWQRAPSLKELRGAILYYLKATEGVAGPFDVVHAFHPALLGALNDIKNYSRAKVFLTLPSRESLNGALASMPMEMEWRTEELLDAVFVSSASLRESAYWDLAIPDSKVCLEYPGIDSARYSRWVDQGKAKVKHKLNPLAPVIFYPGEMCPDLGPDLLLEAVFAVRGHRPNVGLVFGGDGPLLPYLRSRTRVLGMDDVVRFPGFMDEEALIELYNACDLICLPSRDGQLNVTVLRAWSAGKPVVISSSAAPEFFVNEEDGLVAQTDYLSLAQAIEAILSDPDLCGQISRRVWARANQDFSWDSVAGRILDKYREAGQEQNT